MLRTFADFLSGNSIAYFFAWLICGAIALLSLLILWMSFVPRFPLTTGLSFANYVEVFGSNRIWEVLWNTIMVGLGTTVLTVCFGIPLAWLLNRTDMPLRSVFISMLAAAVIIPGLVKAMGWLLLLSPRIGLINRFLMDLFNLQVAPLDINSIWGIAFVQGLMLTPSMFFLISGPMRSLDPALEEAAEVAGAGRWKTLLWVTAPVLWPGILGAVIYNFMTAIAIFEVAALLGGMSKNRVFATELFLAIQPTEPGQEVKFGVAGMYGLLIMLPSLVALYFYSRSIRQAHRYAVITGRGYRPGLFRLGRLRYPAILFVLNYFVLAVFLPFVVLLWMSFLPSLRMPSREALSLVTFRWYQEMYSIIGGAEVLWNTGVLVLASTVLVLVFSFVVSWVVVRTKLRTRYLLDTIAMLPHAIPGIGFAFALLIVGIMAMKWFPWIPFYNTVWIIVVGNILNRLSYTTRITNAALIQVHQELEDAALICGARKWKSMWKVMLPLIRPSLVFAGLWTALLVFRDVSIAVLLVSAESEVLATRLWVHWFRGALSEAAALSVVVVLVSGIVILILQKFTARIVEARAVP